MPNVASLRVVGLSLVGPVPLHATPGDQPPPLTALRLLTGWTWDWPVGIALLVTAALYLWGVHRLAGRGDHWPVARTVSFLVGGLGSALVATMSALGTYDTVLFSMHAAQHLVLMMLTPLFCALGAPMTLALRTLPARGRSVLLAVLHSPVARVLTFTPLALALFIATPFALYYSPFFEVTLRSAFWHAFLHLHFVVVGALLMWPLVGIDPIPGRIRHPLRLLVLFVMLPFHAFLGISIMSAGRLLAEDWYLAFNRPWPPSPLEDQYLGGAVMWGAGDFTALVMMVVLFVQWALASQREATREDRRLDRLEAASGGGRAGGAPGPARYDATAGPRVGDQPSEPRTVPDD